MQWQGGAVGSAKTVHGDLWISNQLAVVFDFSFFGNGHFLIGFGDKQGISGFKIHRLARFDDIRNG